MGALLRLRVALHLAGTISACAQNMETLREAAAAAFRAGKFTEALALYEECLMMPEA